MDSFDWVQLAGTILGSSAIGATISYFFTRRKTSAEAKDMEATAWTKFVDQIQEEVKILRTEVKDLRNENIQMHKQIATLEAEKITMVGKIQHLETELAFYKQVRVAT